MKNKDKHYIFCSWEQPANVNLLNKVWYLYTLDRIVVAAIFEFWSPITRKNRYDCVVFAKNLSTVSSFEEAQIIAEQYLVEKGYSKLDNKLNNFI